MDDATVDALFAELVGDLSAETGPEPDSTQVFTLRADGNVALSLPGPVREVITMLVGQLAGLIDGDGPEAAVAELTRPLFPAAYEDPADAAEFEMRRHASLRDSRRVACEQVLVSLTGNSLDASQVDAWLRVLNDLRLVIARDVRNDDEMEALYDSEPGQVLALLTYLLGELLELITE